MPPMKRASRQQGFTILELMAVVGIMAILLGLGGPAFVDFVREGRLAGSARDLVIDFSLARNEAAVRATRVTVCTSTNLTACSNDSWAKGRIVFVDGGAQGAVNAGDLILSRTPALDTSITTAGLLGAAGFLYSFEPDGRVAALGQIRLCAPGRERRVVTVHRSGSATLTRTNIAC